MPHSSQPLAYHYPVFTYSETNFFASGGEYPSTLSLVCQQLPHPLLALPPFHTPQFRLQYLHRGLQQLQSSSSGTITTIL